MQAIRSALRAAKLLKGLSDEQMHRLAEVVQVMEYKAGDVVFRKGDEGSFFFIVKSGTVHITELGEGVPVVQLTAGFTFGERALLKSEPRAGTVTAETDVSGHAPCAGSGSPAGSVPHPPLCHSHLCLLVSAPAWSWAALTSRSTWAPCTRCWTRT